MGSHLPWWALWKGSVSRRWGAAPAGAPSRAVSHTSQELSIASQIGHFPDINLTILSSSFLLFPFLLLLSFPRLAVSPLSFFPPFFLGLPFPLFPCCFSPLSLSHYSVYMDTFKSWLVYNRVSLTQAINFLLRQTLVKTPGAKRHLYHTMSEEVWAHQ